MYVDIITDTHHPIPTRLFTSRELMYCKCCELVAESIPGTILQLVALIYSSSGSNIGGISMFAIFSICVSIATTAFNFNDD